MLDHISPVSFTYMGAKFKLPYDLNWTLYFGLDPGQGARQVVNYSLRDIKTIQPHTHADGIISFSFPILLKSQPKSIDFSIVDSGGTSLPVRWTPANAADISYSLMQIPLINLSKSLIKLKPQHKYGQLIEWGGR